MNTSLAPTLHTLIAKLPMPQEKLLTKFMLFLAIVDVVFAVPIMIYGSFLAGVIVLLLGCLPYIGLKWVFKKMRDMCVVIRADRTLTVYPGVGKPRVHSAESLSAVVIRQKRVRNVHTPMLSFVRASDQKYADDLPLPRFEKEDLRSFFEAVKKQFPHIATPLTPQ